MKTEIELFLEWLGEQGLLGGCGGRDASDGGVRPHEGGRLRWD